MIEEDEREGGGPFHDEEGEEDDEGEGEGKGREWTWTRTALTNPIRC